ncbi:MAG: endopeptidase La [Deltaproteobacteria bacterium]|nr:endopeptidase La [Deltaproteobacteria bacterium]MBW2051330.1 endopeptidase La [Deltaproteobacteria bacterium]MBW2141291.1 endopeptidase La [Deltaproteobacteria bacterium]MBW2322800.1 endopeptidase La [Deltaproteobacteria bacterium]
MNGNNSFTSNSAGNGPGSNQERSGQPKIPDILAVLPVGEINLFPGLILPLMIMDPKYINVVQETMSSDRMIGLFAVKETAKQKEKLEPGDFLDIGSAGYVLKMSRTEEGLLQVLLQGLSRIRLKEVIEREPYFKAKIEVLSESFKIDKEVEALMSNLRGLFSRLLDLSPTLPKELGLMNQNIEHPGLLSDMIVSALNLKKDEKQDFLANLDIKDRLRKVSAFLQRELDVMELGSKIQEQIRGKIDKGQREFYLREQMKAIKEELGESDDASVELQEIEKNLAEKGFPEEAAKTAAQELERLKKMNPASAEYTVSLTYLDWFLDLPWSDETEDNLDVVQAQKVLDDDHYGLDKIKKRIVQYLAVRKLKPEIKGPILCLVGPPGTGKTSLGRSIARAMGRNFVRLSLGGVRDEAEIRGHRRTYVGALPGRIIQGLKKAGSRNPIFMLDEIDKLGTDFRGDPSSALLEVLDPEQNSTFSDHYLEVEFDLSHVMFITTANMMDTIPPPLLDRMEVLTLSGYTEEEKLAIAKRYLVPRQRAENGLTAKNISFRDASIKRIISAYTREAGLRNLEREIANVCRHVATEVAKGKKKKTIVNASDIQTILGSPRFESEIRARTALAGVATGLAVTQAGGDILFIEATGMSGSKGLILTGQLGDVMKESAQAALSYVRSHSSDLKINNDYFSTHDIHIHIPAGATPKDGPSAGVALATALTSLVTGRPVRSDLAMTGEITLRGLVMPVGGIKEKVLAAKRAGIKSVILPARNEHDLDDVPEAIKKQMIFHPVKRVDEVLDLAFERPKARKKKRRT